MIPEPRTSAHAVLRARIERLTRLLAELDQYSEATREFVEAHMPKTKEARK